VEDAPLALHDAAVANMAAWRFLVASSYSFSYTVCTEQGSAIQCELSKAQVKTPLELSKVQVATPPEPRQVDLLAYMNVW